MAAPATPDRPTSSVPSNKTAADPVEKSNKILPKKKLFSLLFIKIPKPYHLPICPFAHSLF
jgi:hypothetical protein